MSYATNTQNVKITPPGVEHPHTVIISINRPRAKNAVDRLTANELADAFKAFDKDPESYVAILTGEGGTFCSGADLKAMMEPGRPRENTLSSNMDDDGPMGPTRMWLSKPVIAAISGYAVAGGMELALWADLRYSTSFMDLNLSPLPSLYSVVPIAWSTVRLPRLIGRSRARDIILTGRLVDHSEAMQIGLANYIAKPDQSALSKALDVATLLCSHPQECMRNDRLSAMGDPEEERQALAREFEYGMKSWQSADNRQAIQQFLNKVKL
ncbi:enoyl-CoA hydratase/isomerase [Sistotremastrum suecicum HHB10207 ss-3]|uniref:Enoyl-CoA hydratase/isomerase n=1 Tax=Sistotremastrum suecicum HHB10207 ss-3 TaxID=1314776 RepID=A0A166DLM9_9AGAM|nr:enoyl-CoA hydratase/isomerase [Sistotremastrum suecicum HHB10207 ss-3]